MRYIRSNPQQTEWCVIWARVGREPRIVSRHASYDEAVKACWG